MDRRLQCLFNNIHKEKKFMYSEQLKEQKSLIEDRNAASTTIIDRRNGYTVNSF